MHLFILCNLQLGQSFPGVLITFGSLRKTLGMSFFYVRWHSQKWHTDKIILALTGKQPYQPGKHMFCKTLMPGPALQEFVRNYKILHLKFNDGYLIPFKYRPP